MITLKNSNKLVFELEKFSLYVSQMYQDWAKPFTKGN